jgi:hypothetical protein
VPEIRRRRHQAARGNCTLVSRSTPRPVATSIPGRAGRDDASRPQLAEPSPPPSATAPHAQPAAVAEHSLGCGRRIQRTALALEPLGRLAPIERRIGLVDLRRSSRARGAAPAVSRRDHATAGLQ